MSQTPRLRAPRRSPWRQRALIAAALVLTALAASACGGMGKSSSSSSSGSTLSASSTSVGTVLVDSDGRTLYLFLKDKNDTSSCSGACAQNWPPYAPKGAKLTAGGGVKASLMKTTTRSDGSQQLSYDGHPLYTFGGDGKPGDVKGQGVSAFGALWYTVSTSGSAVTKAAPKGGGGAY